MPPCRGSGRPRPQHLWDPGGGTCPPTSHVASRGSATERFPQHLPPTRRWERAPRGGPGYCVQPTALWARHLALSKCRPGAPGRSRDTSPRRHVTFRPGRAVQLPNRGTWGAERWRRPRGHPPRRLAGLGQGAPACPWGPAGTSEPVAISGDSTHRSALGWSPPVPAGHPGARLSVNEN